MKLYVLGLCAGLAFAVPVTQAADAGKTPAAAKADAPKMAAPAVVKEMEELVEAGAQLASASLQKADEFEPYAVLKKKDGSMQVVRYQKPEGEGAKAAPAMEIFKRVTLTVLDVTRKNPDIVAAATFAISASSTADGKTRVPMIRAEVDHREGTPLIVLMPYQRKDGKLEFGSTPSLPGTNILFYREGDAAAAKAAAAAQATQAAGPAPAKAK